MASFDIVPIDQGDADPLTRIGYQAFADDLLNKRLYNLVDPTPEQLEEDLQWRIGRNDRRMHSAGSYWFKAIETATGKPVGYCGILAPEKGKPKGLDTDDSVMPATFNKELYAVIGEKCKALRKQHLGERDDYWYVPSMAVHPDYQGKGIAKRLLQKICEFGDEAGQDVYLESTAAGQSLYKKGGFEVLGELSMLEWLGGEFSLYSMLRKPKSSAA